MSEDELSSILSMLDTQGTDKENNRRRTQRHALNGLALLVTIDQPSRPASTHRVRARNLSQNGVAFLCKTPILPETRLRIQLPIGPNGSIVEKPVIVRRCQHVRGMAHEIGAEFGHFVEKKKPKKVDRIIR